MNISRVTKIRDFLRDQVQDQRFNLDTWVGNYEIPWQGRDDLSCGTSACAMGWATTIPEFKALGLKLVKEDNSSFKNFIQFGDETHFRAVASFLDMDERQAQYLFSPDWYPNEGNTSRMEVVERLDEVIKYGLPDYPLSNTEEEEESQYDDDDDDDDDFDSEDEDEDEDEDEEDEDDEDEF